ncbi:threonylcarbamoyl-AMP synthase [Candidatus Acetothermia bacterium]|nr:threonylcarbamoyl-AMP synthase [Candidatus Acetothermia bacterium]
MPAHILKLNSSKGFSPRAQMRLRRAALGGELIIFPTDTVYGFGCDAFNEKALQKIYELKGRDPQRPLSTHLRSVSEIERYCEPLTAKQRYWLDQLLPGPYTVILKASKQAPKASVSPDGKVGLRVPDSRSFQLLAEAAGVPLVGTSVNRSGQPVFTDIEEIISQFGDLVDLIIVTNKPMSSQSSTVLDLTGSTPKVLRGTLPSHFSLET